MLILGIDPGSVLTGYGVIKSDNTNGYLCLDYGCIRSSSKQDFFERLKKIYDQVSALCLKYKPDYVALEDVFYGKNIKSTLQLGQARGSVVIAALNHNVKIKAYSPREVKQSLTGNGSASKEQVQKMVVGLLGLTQTKIPLDASDALAIAICHSNRFWTNEKLTSQL